MKDLMLRAICSMEPGVTPENSGVEIEESYDHYTISYLDPSDAFLIAVKKFELFVATHDHNEIGMYLTLDIVASSNCWFAVFVSDTALAKAILDKILVTE